MGFSRSVVICFGLLGTLAAARTNCAAQLGVLEGHLNIASLKEVELANDNGPRVPSKAYPQNYAEYPLIILNKEDQKEIARATADDQGNYRVSLPPGDYILDVKGRGPGHVRAKPKPFTILPNQTKRVDMAIDTGIR